MKAIDLPRIQRALSGLDELVKAHPELTDPAARKRLTDWIGEQMARGKKEPDELLVQVFVRMGADLVARLDRHVVKMAAENPGFRPSRSDAIRALLYKALDAEEAAERESCPR